MEQKRGEGKQNFKNGGVGGGGGGKLVQGMDVLKKGGGLNHLTNYTSIVMITVLIWSIYCKVLPALVVLGFLIYC